MPCSRPVSGNVWLSRETTVVLKLKANNAHVEHRNFIRLIIIIKFQGNAEKL